MAYPLDSIHGTKNRNLQASLSSQRSLRKRSLASETEQDAASQIDQHSAFGGSSGIRRLLQHQQQHSFR